MDFVGSKHEKEPEKEKSIDDTHARWEGKRSEQIYVKREKDA